MALERQKSAFLSTGRQSSGRTDILAFDFSLTNYARRTVIPPVPPPKRHPYDQWSPDTRALDLVGDKWTLLIIRDLVSGPRRFVELQRVLPGISTEQLRSRLNRMVADGLLTRQRYREVPPRVEYELTERSRALMPIIAELARWGYEWTWGPPRPSEEVNLGAIFRLAPGLLRSLSDQEGTLECVVSGDDGTSSESYAIVISDGQVQLLDGPAENPEAQVSGTTATWIQVLGPNGQLDRLRYDGDRSFAESALKCLIAGSVVGTASQTPVPA